MRDELVGALKIALLVSVVLLGWKLGNIYSAYNRVSHLSINFEVEEGELAHYVREALARNDANLKVGLAFTLPSAQNVGGPVTQVPHYVHRWLISVTLSPIVVRLPEISDIEAQLWVEDELMLTQAFPFEREEAPGLRLLRRTIALRIENVPRFQRVVHEASGAYGGEVKCRFTGRALTHISFLKVWLPFSTTRYPLVRMPHAEHISSDWIAADGHPIKHVRIGGTAYVSVHFRNPTRVHSIWENVTATIYRVGSEGQVQTIQKEVGVAAGTTANYFFPFMPEAPGTYYFTLEATDGFAVGEGGSPRLEVESN